LCAFRGFVLNSIFSFSPGFSPVLFGCTNHETVFNGFPRHRANRLKRLEDCGWSSTGLKPGENKMKAFEAKPVSSQNLSNS
jgi:hypothetical protein